jgi:predicted peroxiredoxin
MSPEGSNKVVVTLTTGLDDPERVTVAFLLAGGAIAQGRPTVMFLTQEAVRLALPGVAQGEGCEGCPPLERLFQQFADGGGELIVCPYCFNARKLDEQDLVPNARIGGATPLFEWIGEGSSTVFSY